MRRSPLALLAVVALMAALLPATTASAAGGYAGEITIQLVTPSGAALKKSGVILSIDGEGIENQRTTDINGRATLAAGLVPLGVSLGVRHEPPPGSKYMWTSRGIPTTSEAPTTVKLRMTVGASIRGAVKSTSGSPIANAQVRVLTTTGSPVAFATTDSRGAYRFTGLRTGKYRIQFNSREAFAAWNQPAVLTHTWRFWKGSSSWSGSDTISLSQQTASRSASTRTGVNAALSRGRTLTATINAGYPDSDFKDVTIEGTSKTTTFGWKAFPTDTDAQTMTARLNKGYYRIGVIGIDNTTKFWWTGNSTPASSDKTKAKRVYMNGTSNKSIILTLPAP